MGVSRELGHYQAVARCEFFVTAKPGSYIDCGVDQDKGWANELVIKASVHSLISGT
jgi:hypothetical protein